MPTKLVVSMTLAMFGTRVVCHSRSKLLLVLVTEITCDSVITSMSSLEWLPRFQTGIELQLIKNKFGCVIVHHTRCQQLYDTPHSCLQMRVYRIHVIRIGTVGHMIYIVGLHTSVVRRVQCCKLCYSTPYDMSMVVGHSSLLSVNLAFDC